jgi:hypothetical protein
MGYHPGGGGYCLPNTSAARSAIPKHGVCPIGLFVRRR